MADMEVTEDELEEDRTIESMKYEMALEYYEFNIMLRLVNIHQFILN
jgi:hypothetical protein